MWPSVAPACRGVSARRVVTFVLYYCKDEASGVALADVSVVLRYIYILLYLYSLTVITLCVYISRIYDPGNNNA